jgi:MFS family permease
MMAFQVDFSKIKHTEHSGKEISFLQMFERIGAVLGPLIGGILATVFNPRYTIILAIIILLGSLVPIFMSKEPTRINQKITIQGFPWRRHQRDFIVSSAFILENVVSVTIWPLFLGVFVITTNVYAVLGILTAVSTAVALVTILAIGKLIDKQYGKRLLNIGAYINAAVHLLRLFVSSALQAFGISLINEPVTAMYRMPFMKGRFDASDSVPGYRIVYFMLVEWVNAVGNVIFWAIVIAMLAVWPDKLALQATFVIGAILSICITRQRFTALQ